MVTINNSENGSNINYVNVMNPRNCSGNKQLDEIWKKQYENQVLKFAIYDLGFFRYLKPGM